MNIRIHKTPYNKIIEHAVCQGEGCHKPLKKEKWWINIGKGTGSKKYCRVCWAKTK